MKKYYIQVHGGNAGSLVSVLMNHLKISHEKALYLTRIGAVWDHQGKKRIKDPDRKLDNTLLSVIIPAYHVPDYPFKEDDIIFTDKRFFIVYKKGKYPTVPTPYSEVNSLSFALNNYVKRKKPGSQAYIINRLDIHTQGLVFFARDKKTETLLHRMFSERQVKKYYLAGTDPLDGVKNDYIIEDILEWHGKKTPAKTFIHLLKKNEERHCFLVRPYTGRTHQIRKHFATYLIPIRGDPIYGHAERHVTMELICFAYLFPHPETGKKIKVCFLPKDLF